MFSCEIFKIFKNTYFEEHLRTTNCFSDLKRGIRVSITWSFSSTLCNSKANFEAYFMFNSVKLIASKFRQWAWFWTYFSKDSSCFIYFDIIIGQQQQKFRLVELFCQLRKWSKDIWYCATTDIAHAQGSYLTVVQLTFAE